MWHLLNNLKKWYVSVYKLVRSVYDTIELGSLNIYLPFNCKEFISI